ncbi:hypothetical protein [Peterkaempfera sp. SMS 1(5)a]|uniref:hypothetical protein n=1 Tax=Peterkaempfera podocarpi TaxID=3232308 RepID=UPI00366E7CB5
MSAGAGPRGGRPVVAVGGHVDFQGIRWQVVRLAGQHLRLACEEREEVVLAGYLFADPTFALIGPGQDSVPEAAPQCVVDPMVARSPRVVFGLS